MAPQGRRSARIQASSVDTKVSESHAKNAKKPLIHEEAVNGVAIPEDNSSKPKHRNRRGKTQVGFSDFKLKTKKSPKYKSYSNFFVLTLTPWRPITNMIRGKGLGSQLFIFVDDFLLTIFF